MKDDVIVRKAREADASGVSLLWKELAEFHAERDPIFTPSQDGVGKFAAFISSQIQKEHVLVLIAEVAGVPVGYCQAQVGGRPPVFENTRRCDILDLAVTEAFRDRGIGARLVAEVERWCIGRGIARIEVNVASSNDLATSFYRKNGFATYIDRMYKEIQSPHNTSDGIRQPADGSPKPSM